MQLKSTLLCALFLFFAGSIFAQDLHNTLFNFNPLHINPANTGAFSGTVRVGGIYRDQARTALGGDAYSTPSFFADAPVLMVGKRHWIGVGIMAFQDRAGTLAFETSALQFSGSFHFAMDKKSKNILTLGIQGGPLTRNIDCTNATWEDGTDNVCTGGGGGQNQSDVEANATDINAGLLFTSQISKTTRLKIGLSGRHLNNPDLALGNDTEGEQGFRFIGHAGLETPINEKISLEPTVYFTNMDNVSQFQMQAWGGYMLNREKNIKLLAGLGYRFGDAGEFLLGLDYGNLKVGFGYDMTLSDLADVNNGVGAFELAANYIFRVYKKPKVNQKILCPKL